MSTKKSRRVVVTGMGTVSPFGVGVEVLWENLVKGNSGIKAITLFDTSRHSVKIAGEFTDFDPSQYLDKKLAKRMDRYCQFAMIAANEAMEMSGIQGNIEPERLGVIVGSAAGGIGTIEKNDKTIQDRGPTKCSPFCVPMMIVDISAGRISIAHKAKGINKCAVSACATAAHSIGDAYRAIQYGDADAIIAGGAEAAVTTLGMAGFASARTLSSRNDEPTKASRPFDKDRDGFVMAEGAGIIVLEEYEHAKARKANILAEIIGYGATGDAYDIVAPHPEGDGAARAMICALNDAEIKPEAIKYINSHGTGTGLGDIGETKAVKRVFGEYAKNGLLVGSSKSMTGHLLGATAGIEAATCVKTLLTGIVTPTINLDTPDEQCDLDYIPNKARQVDDINYVMSNSFGFGGHNASLIFKKYEA